EGSPGEVHDGQKEGWPVGRKWGGEHGASLCCPGWSQTPGPKSSSQSAGITSPDFKIFANPEGDCKKGPEVQTQKQSGPL
uniref:Uncharacterized protein n=1 Tax=Colobus angolensis palliatus TaxID=336983 RepID=A0A2K5KEI9_COLAP